ncbi:MAG: methyltransferase [Rhizobiales bacterium]|nr:methyltransferase [Hyphomicrobiales bacterium]
MGAERAAPETSEDAVLGGRLRLRQPLRGHRVGHDAILLAAATNARAGEQAVDLGAGVGGAGLALAVRVGGLHVTLVEIDEMLCGLAAENARLNKLDDRVRALLVDAEGPQALSAAGLAAASIDRVLMNPPFNDARRQNVSPDPRRRLAHAGAPNLLPRWVATAAFLLKPQGVLTLIWRADALADVLGALAGEFGDIAVLPVLPRPEAAAIRVLVSAVRGGRAQRRDYPALVLNDADGRPTAAAEAVLRAGDTLMVSET